MPRIPLAAGYDRGTMGPRMGKALSAIAIVCPLLVVCAPAPAATPPMFSYTGGVATFQGGIVAGTSFTVGGDETITSLGFVDPGGDGLAASYEVGLWDTNTQTLLASTTVTPSSKALIGGFRYAPIPATTIPGGSSFTIGALLPPTLLDAW